jgi:hypothetical protein
MQSAESTEHLYFKQSELKQMKINRIQAKGKAIVQCTHFDGSK